MIESAAGVGGVSGVVSLGNINTKFATPPTQKRDEAQQDKQAKKRIARYDLQRESAKLLPARRVSKCCWCNVKSEISIIKQSETKNTRFDGGLMRCGGVWVCPVCSAKITERRRIEIREALELWQSGVFMVTFTLQHEKSDSLTGLLTALNDTLRAFQSGAAWDRLKDRYQIAGSIRAVEITVSTAAGWHPHAHMLFFTNCKKPDILAIKADFYKRYSAILTKKGKYASFAHGVDVREGDTAAADYVAKVGIESPKTKRSEIAGADFEIAKGLQKSGRAGGNFTPFDLLALSAGGDVWAGVLFKEFAESTQGINQIRWGRGLRDLLGIGKELSDIELVESEADTGGRAFYTFTKMVWKSVRMSKARKDQRGLLLEVARETTADQYQDYINILLVIDGRAGLQACPMIEASLYLGGVGVSTETAECKILTET
jgi:hypothetical protein